MQELIKKLESFSVDTLLEYLLQNHLNETTFSTSFGAEDQAVTNMLCCIDKNVDIFTLDTGRLHSSTHQVWQNTREKYGINIKCFFPSSELVQEMTTKKGMYSFYESIEARKECCFARKVEPLKRAIKDYKFWITGLRSEQASTRESLKMVEIDQENQIIKINPLFNWSEKDVWDYIKKENIPYNKLHDEGYPSIGCEPCTRAVKSGDDTRNGRWWWESPEKKECGLHIGANK